MVADDELLHHGYRVVGSLLLLLAVSEIIPGLARTLGTSKTSKFIHHAWEGPLLFMLILVGHDERSFSLQINMTKDITSMVQWVKDFYISFFVDYSCLQYFNSFTILILTVNTQLAIASSLVLAMEILEQGVMCVLVSVFSTLSMNDTLFWFLLLALNK